MSWIKTTAALAVGLALVACSKQEPQALQSGAGVNTINTTSTYTGPRETVSLSLQAGFGLKESESEARALDGSVFYRGRLRPHVEGDKANILLFLGSETLNILDKQSLEFDYDKETNSIHYRGKMTVPAGLLQAQDLKMFMVAVDPSKLNDNTLTMSNVKTTWYENKEFADGEKLPISVPYFSDWLEVSQYVKGDLLDVARTKVTMRPQGHVIKMQLSSNVTSFRGMIAKSLQVESTAISDQGVYTLPSGINDIGTKPAFTPELTAVSGHDGLKFRKFEIPLSADAESLDASKTRSIYLWVGPISGATKTWTRSFVHIQNPNPILDPSFTGGAGWWDGHPSRSDKKIYPVYYTKSSFTSTGSTMAMNVANTTVVSPLHRIPYSLVSTSYLNQGTNSPDLVNEAFNLVRTFGDRQMTAYSRYTWPWLQNQGYVGDSAQDIMFPNATEPNTRTATFRIPTLEEFRMIFPTDGANRANRIVASVTERVKLGNKNTPPMNYTSSYQYYDNVQGSRLNGMIGIRFMGGDDRYKMVYRYRRVDADSPGSEAEQIQTFYLGAYFPEIQTAEDFVNFNTNYPGAYIPNIPEERVIATNVLARRDTEPIAGGVRIWVNESDGQNATYVQYNARNGWVVVKKALVDGTDNQKNAVLVIRDL